MRRGKKNLAGYTPVAVGSRVVCVTCIGKGWIGRSVADRVVESVLCPACHGSGEQEVKAS